MRDKGSPCKGNIYSALPPTLDGERFEDILRLPNVRIERICSQGQSSPASGWYDQDEHEWVCVLQGAARLEFDDGEVCELAVGDYVNIPAHRRHWVAWSDPNAVTVWLAVFYR